MILVRAPFRASFLGGGSDLPEFYRRHGGAVLSTAINRHVFLTGREMYDKKETLLKYSRTERVTDIDVVEHPLFREALKFFGISGVDIGVSSDIPAGTGLGSSSAFTVALVQMLTEMSNRHASPKEVAELACKVEIELVGDPIGKQDQFASAMGGLNLFVFSPDDSVSIHPIYLSPSDLDTLNQSLWLAQLPSLPRSAASVLREMTKHQQRNKDAVDATLKLAELALKGFQQIKLDGVEVLPALMREAWDLKVIANPAAAMDVAGDMLTAGLAAGADAGKLLGAGGGGFVLFWVPPKNIKTFTREMEGVRLLRVRPDLAGVTTIYKEDN